MRNRYLPTHYRVNELVHQPIARDYDDSLICLNVDGCQMILAVIALGCTDQVEGEVGVCEEVLHAVKVLGGIGASIRVEVNNCLQFSKFFYWPPCDKPYDIQLKTFILCCP